MQNHQVHPHQVQPHQVQLHQVQPATLGYQTHMNGPSYSQVPQTPMMSTPSSPMMTSVPMTSPSPPPSLSRTSTLLVSPWDQTAPPQDWSGYGQSQQAQLSPTLVQHNTQPSSPISPSALGFSSGYAQTGPQTNLPPSSQTYGYERTSILIWTLFELIFETLFCLTYLANLSSTLTWFNYHREPKQVDTTSFNYCSGSVLLCHHHHFDNFLLNRAAQFIFLCTMLC